MLTKTSAYPSGVGALPAISCVGISSLEGQGNWDRTEKSGSAKKASAVSGLGTGPGPDGWGEQAPRSVRLLFGRSVVMGLIGAGATFLGTFDSTSRGAATRTGSGAAMTWTLRSQHSVL